MFRTKRKKVSPPRQPRIRPETGLKSPQAFSYHAKRSQRETDSVIGGRDMLYLENQAKQKQSSKLPRILLLTALIALLMVVVFELRVSSNANIRLIYPSNFNYQPHSLTDYSRTASAAIDSSIYNRLKLTLSSNDIASYLENVYPEIADAGISVPLLGTTPTVYIQLAMPELIYRSGPQGFVINNNGVVIANATALTAKQLAQLPSVQSSLNLPLKDGNKVLTEDNVKFIQTVSVGLKAKAIAVNRINLLPSAEELDVYITGQPYYVKFNLAETDALQQIGTYLATLNTLKQQNKTPSQYIDVRVDGRAYYK